MKKGSKLFVCIVIAIVTIFSFSVALAASPVGGSVKVEGLPSGVTYTVTNVYNGDSAALIKKSMSLGSTTYVSSIFEITLSQPVPNGSYKVTVDLSGVSAYKSAKAYHGATLVNLETNSGVSTLSATISGDKIVFNTANFSTFAVALTKGTTNTTTGKSPKTGYPDYTALLIALIAAGVFGSVCAIKKFRKVS